MISSLKRWLYSDISVNGMVRSRAYSEEATAECWVVYIREFRADGLLGRVNHCWVGGKLVLDLL